MAANFLKPIGAGTSSNDPLPVPPTIEDLLGTKAAQSSSGLSGLGGAALGPSFSGQLGELLADSRQRDTEAQEAVESFSRTDDPGRIHETMIALSKAEISLRTVASVRNKLIDAYRELLHVTT